MTPRLAPLVVAAACALGTPAVAQFEAPTLPDDQAARAAPEEVAQAFVDGCIVTEGALTPAVDWAINAGWMPVDASAVDVRPLLGSQPGTVLAMPGTAHGVLLAVTADGGCTVWAERLPGPALRAAFQQALAQLARRGGRLQPVLDRSVERAGAWRQHLQLRYRRVGGSVEHAVGAVTTLTPAPAQQALHLSPAPRHVDPEPPAVTR